MPTATTRMTRYLWDVELRAHAIANAYYVCGVNKVGVDVGGIEARPPRQQHDREPQGEVLAEASATTDDIAMADVDLSTLPALRSLLGLLPRPAPRQVRPGSRSFRPAPSHPAAAAQLTGTR